MSTTLTPTTELEAVNQMLATIQEAPINSLQGVGSLDAQKAIDTLAEVSRDLQTPGWNFNTEIELPLPQDAFTGEINLPKNTLSVEAVDFPDTIDLVQRGQRLYDRKGHTFNLPLGTSVKATLVVLLEFADLPEAARRYISIRSCRLFQKRQVGSQTLDGFTAEEEATAMRQFKRVMGATSNPNIFNSPDMQRMLQRR